MAQDAAALLDAAGYTLAQDRAAASVSLELEALEARQRLAGMNMKGTTTAVVTVSVTAARSGATRSWRFSETGQVRMVYARSRDMESAVEAAYCRVLSDILVLFQSEEFLQTTSTRP